MIGSVWGGAVHEHWDYKDVDNWKEAIQIVVLTMNHPLILIQNLNKMNVLNLIEYDCDQHTFSDKQCTFTPISYDNQFLCL